MKSLLRTFAAAALGLFAATASAADTVGKMAYTKSSTREKTDYFDTEYIPLADSPFIVELQGNWTQKNTKSKLFGLMDSTRYEFGTSQGYWSCGNKPSSTLADTDEHEFIANFFTGEFLVDGKVMVSDAGAAQVANATIPFYLFKRNPGNTGYGFCLRRCKFTQGGVIKRKFVPWKDSKQTICLYDHATKRCFYMAAKGSFSSAALGANDFYYTIDNDNAASPQTPTTLQVRRGTVDDVEILTMHNVVEKLGADTTVTLPDTATNFPALKLSEGGLSFVDHAATPMTVDGELTLAGGTTLKIDVVGSACDSFAPTSVVFPGLSVENPLTIEVSATTPDFSEGVTVISQGVIDDVADSIKAVQGSVELAVKVKDGKLILTQPQTPVAYWTNASHDGNVANPDNWAYTNALGHAEWRVPDENTIVYLNGSLVPDITGTFAALLVQADVTLEKDCNWSGLTSPLAGMVDLNGHKLTVSQLNGDCEITDSTRILPTTYEQLEYIQSTGSQFIDTEYVPLASPAFAVAVQGGWVDISHTSAANLMGLMDANGQYAFGVNFNKSGTPRYNACDATGYDPLPDTNEYLYTVDFGVGEVKGDFKRDDTVVCSGITPKTEDALLPFFLFSRNNGSGTVKNACWFRLRWCKLMQGAKVVRDFVPVRERAGSRRVGLYDLVTAKFYFRQGSGEFAAGNVVAQTETASGELHVSNDVAIVNSTVALTRALRLVKEGAGSLTVAKANQNYYGGTEVAGGVLAVAADSERENKFLGAEGAEVKVGTGATLELNGNAAFDNHSLVLAGGAVRNSSATAVIGDVTLAADSAIGTEAGACIELSGSIGLGASVESAAVTVTGEGTFRPTGAAKDLTSVGLVLDGALDLATDVTVGDMKVTYAGSAKSGEKSVFVRGTYAPASAYVNNFVMQDGSAMDFREKDKVVIVDGRTLSFADDATISVLPPATYDGKLIDWTGCAPSNIDTVTFVLVPESRNLIEKTPNGLYFLHVGLKVIIR